MKGGVGMEREFFTEKETADFLGLARQTLSNWRFQKVGPDFVRVGNRSIRYRRGDVERWADSRRVRPAEEGRRECGRG